MTTKTRFTNGGSASNGTKKTTAPVWTGKKTNTGKKKSLEYVFETELLNIYSAEKQLLKAIPRWAKASDSEDLQDAFQNSYEQTSKQIERIEKIADRLGIEVTVTTTVCEPMQSLIEVCDEVTETFEPGTVRDSAIIVATQKVEHFEIASYGSLRELAEVLGYHKIATLLDRSLHEEGQVEHILSQIAMDVNDEASEWAEKEKQGMLEYEYR